MAELADARDLKSRVPLTERAGSTPAPGKFSREKKLLVIESC